MNKNELINKTTEWDMTDPIPMATLNLIDAQNALLHEYDVLAAGGTEDLDTPIIARNKAILALLRAVLIEELAGRYTAQRDEQGAPGMIVDEHDPTYKALRQLQTMREGLLPPYEAMEQGQ